MDENLIGKVVVDAAITVHSEVGPGLLQSVYELILLDELLNRELVAKRQLPIPIKIRGVRFDEGFRADIIVENKVTLANLAPWRLGERNPLWKLTLVNKLSQSSQGSKTQRRKHEGRPKLS